ncbi:MAG: Holliday junction resolvase RuvX [Bryobacterales bacterium]|nr:Holliday junction resolvase RuvX [Bryobacterales bacterium]
MRDPVAGGQKRILGLDVGVRRIGLALSDPLGITAQGIETLVRGNLKKDLARLSRLAEENDVGLFVVGLPLHMSGGDSRQGGWVKEFAVRLEQRSRVPVRLWDERLTTVEATRVLRESGISIEKRAKAVDRLSAVLILQSYLDSLPGVNDCPNG